MSYDFVARTPILPFSRSVMLSYRQRPVGVEYLL